MGISLALEGMPVAPAGLVSICSMVAVLACRSVGLGALSLVRECRDSNDTQLSPSLTRSAVRAS